MPRVMKPDHALPLETRRSHVLRGRVEAQTYDINDAGQVRTYLRYLACLPYKEQLC
jgi:hypothetical protein